MARILLTEKPTATCNQVIFTLTPAQRFEYMRRTITVHDIRHLKSLIYKAFLQTLYWSIIREQALQSGGGKCSACPSTYDLDVHHKSYRFQGEEFRAMDCLAILCRACHTGGHLEVLAKSEQEKLNAVLTKISLSHHIGRSKSKANRAYDPRMLMNLKQYGDIRGYQGSTNGTTD